MSKKTWKSVILPVLSILALVASGTLGWNHYWQWKSLVSTDNAQIDGEITPVNARTSGVVRDIRFSDDQYVRAGDTLLILENRESVLRLEDAMATLAAQQASVVVARTTAVVTHSGASPTQSGINAAKIRLENAKRELTRQKQLMEHQATTGEKVEAATAELAAATAELASAQGRMKTALMQSDLADRQISASQAAIRQKEAQVEMARLQLAYTTVIAPTNGFASKRMVHAGQLVASGTGLLSIVQRDSLRVVANLKETQLEGLRIGAMADVKVDAVPGHAFHGRVASICGASGVKFSLFPPDNATGNFVKVVQRVPVRIVLDPDPSVGSQLRPGMSASVDLHLD